MVRLTALALVVILIFIQLSSIECKKNGNKKNKGCKFNGDTLTAEAKRTYDDMCVELVCHKLKRKGKEQKKGGGGKRKNKFKYVFVAEAIKYCYPNKCKDIECDGPCMPPCATVNERCMPPVPNITAECPTICTADYAPVCGSDGKTYSNACTLSVASCQNPNDNIATVYGGECRTDKCEDPSSACPAEWQCTVEKYTDPDTGCTKCRCNSEDPQYEEFCRPVASICPMDCGVIKFVDENTGCRDCKCDPGDNDNPFAPLVPKPTISAESSRDWPSQDGCNTCTCMNGIAACTEMACIDEDSSICKTGCSKDMVLVCGSDGVTYENSCMLDFARICKGTNVKLDHPGPCDGDKGRAMKCKSCNKRKWEPVCGDDCKTYPNECMLDYENCENGKDVKQVMRGSCEDGGNNGTMKCIPCNKRKWDPVCGDDGKTYSNACMLDFANCENGSDVKQVKKGECEGDKMRKVKRPKREIRRSKEKKRKLLGKDKNKEKKGKCMYNGKRVKKVKDLDIYCTQLKCTKDKETRSSKLEMQSKSDCKC